jgi:hypothetical protein
MNKRCAASVTHRAELCFPCALRHCFSTDLETLPCGGNMDKRLKSRANKGDPNLRRAVGEIIHRISASLPPLKTTIKMYLAGGMAVNFYTGSRVTVDIDATFSHRLLLPKAEDLVVSYEGAGGKPTLVYFDLNFNASFTLMHPDFDKEAYRVEGEEFEDPKIDLHILTPTDLALSKIARFEANDREDIAELAHHQLVEPQKLEERAVEALDYYIGNPSMLILNLKDAVEIVRTAQGRGDRDNLNDRVES